MKKRHGFICMGPKGLASMGTALVALLSYVLVSSGTELPRCEIIQVKRGEISNHVLCNGRLIVDTPATVSAPFAGRIASLAVMEGDKIDQGVILGELESSELLSSMTKTSCALSVLESEAIAARRRLSEEPLRNRVSLKDAELALLASRGRLKEGSKQLLEAQFTSEQARVEFELQDAKVKAQKLLRQKDYLAESSYNADLKQLELCRLALTHARRVYTRLKHELSSDVEKEAVLKVERADAQVALAKTKLDSLKQDLTSDLQLVEKKLHAKTRELSHLENLWNSRFITAPCNGIIGQIKLRAGAGTLEGAAILEIFPKDGIVVESEVDEIDAPRLRVDQLLLVSSPAFENETFPARVSFISPRATFTNSHARVKIRCRFDNPSQAFKPGMSVEMDIVTTTVADELLVPATAIFTKRQLESLAERPGLMNSRDRLSVRHKEPRFVLAFRPNVDKPGIGTSEMVAVKLGLSDELNCHVIEGLVDGDRILMRRPAGHEPGGRLQVRVTGKEQ